MALQPWQKKVSALEPAELGLRKPDYEHLGGEIKQMVIFRQSHKKEATVGVVPMLVWKASQRFGAAGSSPDASAEEGTAGGRRLVLKTRATAT